jgi:hypothetical protein
MFLACSRLWLTILEWLGVGAGSLLLIAGLVILEAEYKPVQMFSRWLSPVRRFRERRVRREWQRKERERASSINK